MQGTERHGCSVIDTKLGIVSVATHPASLCRGARLCLSSHPAVERRRVLWGRAVAAGSWRMAMKL